MVEKGVTPEKGTPGAVLGSFLRWKIRLLATFVPVTSIAPSKVPLFWMLFTCGIIVRFVH